MALNSALSKDEMAVKRRAAEEVTGSALQRTANKMSTAMPQMKSNPMTQRASEPSGTPRQFGDTVTSGEGQVIMNGQKVGASNPAGGQELGNMADVTAGVRNAKDGFKGNIGLDETSGNLTYGGKDMGIKASDFAQGADRARLSDGYTRATGDSVMRGREYFNSKGLGELVKWDDATKTMTVGGINVPYLYITDDGNAMVPQSVLDNALSQVQKNMGVKSGVDVAQGIYGKYDRNADRLTDRLINRGKWEYNPQTDPVYQAYARVYQRNAERAYNRAMGSGGLYGAPSSYQHYQALAGYGDNMQELSDAVPTLAQMDYQRYADEITRDAAALDALQRERAYEYEMLYGANENQLDRAKESDATNYNRRYDDMFRYPMAANELSMSNVDRTLYPMIANINLAIQQGELDSVTVRNDIARIEEIYNRAMLNGGEFSAEDKAYLGIPADASTKAYTSEIKAALDMYYQAQKPIALDQIASGL